MQTPKRAAESARMLPALLAAGALCCGVDARAAPVPLPGGHETGNVNNGSAMLAPHKALYELTLESTHGGGTVAASGSMSFQVTDTCSGWASQQQLRLQLVTREGQASDMVSDYATLESKDGRHLTFDMQERDNSSVTQQVRGEASLDAAGDGEIRFTLPKRSTMALPRGTLFPMAHTAAIIAAARAGIRSIDPVLFDGTSADGPTDSYVTILNWQAPPSQSDYPSLAAQGSGRVHVSFFPRNATAITPDYEIGMRYFADGVSDRLDMDFGDVTMRGRLTGFTPGKRPDRC